MIVFCQRCDTTPIEGFPLDDNGLRARSATHQQPEHALMLNSDLWPHIWAFNTWAAIVSAVMPFDPFNPNDMLDLMEKNR